MITLISFGHAFGTVKDANPIFDLRKCRDPQGRDDLRKLNGTHPEVKKYVEGLPEIEDKLKYLIDIVGTGTWKNSNLTIGVGCLVGKHRSVAFVELAAARLRARGYEVRVFHGDLWRHGLDLSDR